MKINTPAGNAFGNQFVFEPAERFRGPECGLSSPIHLKHVDQTVVRSLGSQVSNWPVTFTF
jgi:hypothetical protein